MRSYELFERDGRSLSFTKSGSGPPLLLVHGLSGSRRWWRHNVAAFERRFTVYRLELVGFGYARRQPPLPLKASAALLAAWMKTADLPSAFVLGHSMGGHTCIHLASAYPDLVRKLVLATPTGLLRSSWVRAALKLPRAGLSGRPDFLPIVATDALRAGVTTLYRASRELLRDDVSTLCELVQAPTLVISGGRDVLVPPEVGLSVSKCIPNARHVLLPTAGHVVMWDAPSEFNKAVLDFLEDG